MLQCIYRNTGLTPDDVLKEKACGRLQDFRARWRDDGVHVMLDHHPKYQGASVQVSRYSANVWASSYDQLYQLEEMLNETFSMYSTRPFENGEIKPRFKDLQGIQDTLLGQLASIMYYSDQKCFEESRLAAASAVSAVLKLDGFHKIEGRNKTS